MSSNIKITPQTMAFVRQRAQIARGLKRFYDIKGIDYTEEIIHTGPNGCLSYSVITKINKKEDEE